MKRIMIFDGAPAQSQQAIASHGGPSNTEMFERALSLHESGLQFFSLNVADGERLPQGAALADFDGIVITGSPLSVYEIRPEVTRQIELAREAFRAGVPIYGSCWGPDTRSWIGLQSTMPEVRANKFVRCLCCSCPRPRH